MRTILGLTRSIIVYYNPMRFWELRRFYRALLGSGSLAFDIGAHVGNRSRAMRAAGAKVVAVEPQRAFARFLRLTLPSDVVLIDAAVGPQRATVEMAVSSLHPTVSSLDHFFVASAATAHGFEQVKWDSKQRVEMVTLDDLIAEHGRPDFVKIDVEGFEPLVLSGLSVPLPLLAFEFLPAMLKSAQDVIQRLEQLGRYEFNAIQGEAGSFLWTTWKSAEETAEWLRKRQPTERSGDLYARLVD